MELNLLNLENGLMHLHYEVDKKQDLIDYESVEKIALENKPKLIIAGGSAYSRIIDFKKFREKFVIKLVHIYLLIWLISLD